MEQSAMADPIKKCPVCGYDNRAGEIDCQNCGASLENALVETSTRPLDSAPHAHVLTSKGTATFGAQRALRIEIEGSAQPIRAQPQPEVVLGRRDPGTGATPEVDLTPFAGYRMGVSRRHAAIRASGDHLHVWDLGSSNGTFLNGQRLTPDRPYMLHDGDEIRLGQMVVRIYFE